MANVRFVGLSLCISLLCASVEAQSVGLIAAYSFNDGTGATVTESSGFGPDGAIAGATWTEGRFGNGLSFDGTNDRVAVAGPNLPSSDLTWMLWVKRNNINAFQTMLEAQGTTAAELELSLENGRIVVWSSGGQRLVTNGSIPSNTWTHVALTRSGSVLRAYINGVADPVTGSDGRALNFGSCPLLMGVDSDSGCTGLLNGYLNGTMDEVRIYNRALSQSEIQTDMITPIGSAPPPGSSGPCDVTGNGLVDDEDVSAAIGLSLEAAPCSSLICVGGVYTVVAVQRVVNAIGGGSCVTEGGGGLPHSVVLDWIASVSPNVIGYYVYRGTTHNGPYDTKLTSLPTTSTSFTDNDVQNGQTYYYVSTSVDGNGAESAYSNEAQATIPSS